MSIRGIVAMPQVWHVEWRESGGDDVKQSKQRTVRPSSDEDTMRSHYDFSNGVRGVTARRFAKGSNVVVIDPSVAAVFPDSKTVSEALRTLARIVRSKMNPVPRKRSS